MTARTTSANGDSASGANTPARHTYGLQPLAALIPSLTRAMFRRHGTATARLLLDWEAIVGPALADLTLPRRLSAGTLTIGCAGPIATELQHLSAEILERINAALGPGAGGKPAVERLRFVQDMRLPRSPQPVSLPQGARAPDLPDMPPGPVRDALQALGAAMRASTPAARDDKL